MDVIHLRGIVMEDFCNYKKPSMFLITTTCDWKCCHDGGFSESVCQNEPMIRDTKITEYTIKNIYDAYTHNRISKAIVFGGLEPFKQVDEIISFIKYFREHDCFDDIVIYTGYNKDEIDTSLFSNFGNIIIKFGRYIPNQKPHYDEILGIELASDNQYAENIKN